MNEFEDQRLKSKTCSSCQRDLPLSAFNRNSSTKDGWRSNCRSCARDSKASWHQRNKPASKSRRKQRRQQARDYVISKKNAPCVDCGSRFHHSLMEFDHVRDEKIDNVSRLITASLSAEAIQAEIDKCDLVCVMCHRIRTWNRGHPDDTIVR